MDWRRLRLKNPTIRPWPTGARWRQRPPARNRSGHKRDAAQRGPTCGLRRLSPLELLAPSVRQQTPRGPPTCSAQAAGFRIQNARNITSSTATSAVAAGGGCRIKQSLLWATHSLAKRHTRPLAIHLPYMQVHRQRSALAPTAPWVFWYWITTRFRCLTFTRQVDEKHEIRQRLPTWLLMSRKEQATPTPITGRAPRSGSS
jgi:hypothetical protein